MYSSTLPTMALALASTALGVAIPKRQVITSGTNPGSLFMFGAASVGREEFFTEGSCGLSTYFPNLVPASTPLVAMPASVMNQFGVAQHNTLCGQVVTMTDPSNGVTQQAAVADTNEGSQNSIDMTTDLWAGFGQNVNDASQINILNWSIGGSSSGSGGGGGGSSGSCSETYTVVSGDTCDGIASQFGITLSELESLNPSLDSACDIDVGQVLCV